MHDQKTRKTLIINRAVPGSGKTTISNCIVSAMKAHGLSTAIHSTDEYFMAPDGRYVYDITKLYAYHQQNFKVLLESLKKEIDVVICDNVNLSPWQTRPYTQAAREFGYYIIFVTFEPRELDKHILSQRVTAEKPDAHGVAEDVIIAMIEEYHSYSGLMDKDSRIDPEIHLEYAWDSENNMKIPTGNPSPPFDLDAMIEINPHEYHDMQTHIGHDIIQMMILTDKKH